MGAQACPCGHAEKIISTIVHDAARSPVSKAPDALLDAEPAAPEVRPSHPINADNLGQAADGHAVDSHGNRWSLASAAFQEIDEQAVREKKLARISQKMESEGMNLRMSGIIEGTGASLMCHSITQGGVEGVVGDDEKEGEEESQNDGVIETPDEEEETVTRNTIAREVVNTRASHDQAECVSKIHPDFSGTWKMVKFDGDWDGFLKEMGVGWAFRTAASAVGYGNNKTFHTIKQAVERIQIETKNQKGTFIKDYAIDATEQDDVDPVDKGPIKVIPYWHWQENEHVAILVVEAFKPRPTGEDPFQMPITRRYLGENKQNGNMPNWMILEQVTPKGITASRCFERQDASKDTN